MEEAMPLKAKRRFKGRYLLLAVILLFAAGGVGTGTYLWLGGGQGESIRVVTAVQLTYPDGWRELPLTEADRKAGLLLKLERGELGTSFLARTVIGRLAPDFDIHQLGEDVEKALRAEIDNFDLVGREASPIGRFNAIWIYYRQTGEDETADYRTLMAIVPTLNQTFYLTLRAEERDFRRVEDEGLQIIRGFVDYIGARIE